jgi:formylglycine-generating enzyme required for sulfatase activity
LKVLLQGYPALRLAFLNTCEGGRSDEQDIFLGVAPALVRCGLPAVIAMKYSISDRAAIALSTEFYRALADGYPVEAALAEARKAIYVGQQSVEWGTPLLFSRSADNRLLTLPASGESATKKAQSTLPPASQSISTSGGMYSAGNVNVGGSLVGRDQIINNYYNPPTPAPAATPSPLLAAEITRKDFEPETILIAEGEFLMGSLPEPGISPYETPQHPVHLSAYRIGKYLVTNGEFEEFVQRTGWIVSPQMGWNGQAPYRDKRDFPVIGLTWYEALEYCRWLSKETERTYTLPNEAQWEKAERGVEGRLYPWGNEWEEGRCNIGGIGVAAKDKFPAQSVNGCYDWVGNVRQWTCGLWGEELREPDRQYLYKWKEDSRNHLQANNQIRRVWRGAAYSDKPPRARCSARGAELPTSAGLPNKWFGFRVVMLLTKEDNS